MKIQRLFLLLILLLLVYSNSMSLSGKRIVYISSSVVFSIQNAGLEVKGTVGGIKADINFDPQNLAGSYIKATANPASIKSGISLRDKHLQASDYFDTKNYPRIVITSKVLRKTGKNRFTGQFEVMVKGITKEIIIPFTRKVDRNSTSYQGSFEFNRVEFELGEKSMILDDKVKINIQVQVQK